MLTDLLVLAVTWSKTVGIWKASQSIDLFKPKISILLLQDGAFYTLPPKAYSLFASKVQFTLCRSYD